MAELSAARLHLVSCVDEAAAMLRWLGERREILAVDTETTGLAPWRDTMRLVQLGDENEAWCVPWERWGGVAVEALGRWFADGNEIVGHNVTFDVAFLERAGVRVPRERCHDTRIAAHVLNSAQLTGLKPLASRLIDRRAGMMSTILDEAMLNQGWTWATVPLEFEPYWSYAALDTILTARLWAHDVIAAGTDTVAYDVERAAAFIVRDMETRGCRIDVEHCETTFERLMRFSDETEAWCLETYGCLPGSNTRVAQVLIDAGVELTARTKTGQYQLTADILERIDHPLAKQALARRRALKIATTYLENFLKLRSGDLLHPSINPMEAKTGRMSITDPALQTLPRAHESNPAAILVRDAFIPRDGHVLVSIDFDQIEMRLLAHFARDESLLKAIAGGDLHTDTAKLIYNDPTIDKKDPRRAIAKQAGFAKVYGAGIEKFSWTAGVSVEAGREFLNRYDESFPGVRRFQSTVVRTGEQRQRDEGLAYVTTPLGRRLIADSDKVYALVNYLIQGTAAEVLKEALMRLDQAGLGEYLLLPVHDEVILDLPIEDAHELASLAVRSMTDDRWTAPLTVEASPGLERWGNKYR